MRLRGLYPPKNVEVGYPCPQATPKSSALRCLLQCWSLLRRREEQSTALVDREGKKVMAKTNHLGALAAAVGATLVAVGLLVLMMLLVVDVQPAEAAFPGKNGKIAYSGSDGNDFEIFTIDPGGGNRFQVTDNNNKRGDIEPSFSPDGKRIAYVGSDGHDREIFTIGSAGGKRVNVTNNKMGDFEPSFSPDGKRIAYSGYDRHDYEIFTISVDGGNRFQVTHHAGVHTGGKYPPSYVTPDYSPDGKKIAYSRCHEGGCGGIYAIAATGGDKAVVITPLGGAGLSYSPDGKKIALGAVPKRNGPLLFTIGVGGAGRSKVTNGFDPSWGKPHGRGILGGGLPRKF